jgi:hypothetical protein
LGGSFFLQAPVMVNSRLLQQPERREALGMFLCLTLLWRLGESAAVKYLDTSFRMKSKPLLLPSMRW